MLEECSPVEPKGNISSMLDKLEASIDRLNNAVSSIVRKVEPFSIDLALGEAACGGDLPKGASMSPFAESIDSKATRIDELARRLEYIRQAIDD